MMIAILGATGQIGGMVAKSLLQKGEQVKAKSEEGILGCDGGGIYVKKECVAIMRRFLFWGITGHNWTRTDFYQTKQIKNRINITVTRSLLKAGYEARTR